MDDKVKFKRQLSSRGDSDGLNLPKELLAFIDVKVGDELTLVPDSSKHGKYIAIFKEEKWGEENEMWEM